MPVHSWLSFTSLPPRVEDPVSEWPDTDLTVHIKNPDPTCKISNQLIFSLPTFEKVSKELKLFICLFDILTHFYFIFFYGLTFHRDSGSESGFHIRKKRIRIRNSVISTWLIHNLEFILVSVEKYAIYANSGSFFLV